MTTLAIQIPPVTCPCCGQAVDRQEWTTFRSTIVLSPKEALLVDCLAQRFGQWVMHPILDDAVWGKDIDGGPIDTCKTLTGMRVRINQKLAGSDFIIEGRPHGGGCRLTWRARSA